VRSIGFNSIVGLYTLQLNIHTISGGGMRMRVERKAGLYTSVRTKAIYVWIQKFSPQRYWIDSGDSQLTQAICITIVYKGTFEIHRFLQGAEQIILGSWIQIRIRIKS
jgi:hypothetical protein